MFYSVCLGNPTPCLFLSERCIWLPKTAVKRQAFLRDHSALFLVIAQFFTHLRCLIAAMIEIAPQITRIQSEEAVMFFLLLFIWHICPAPSQYRNCMLLSCTPQRRKHRAAAGSWGNVPLWFCTSQVYNCSDWAHSLGAQTWAALSWHANVLSFRKASKHLSWTGLHQEMGCNALSDQPVYTWDWYTK